MNDVNNVNEYLNNTVDVNSSTTENTIDTSTDTVSLETIHNDLGFICVFLILATIYVLCRLIYKGLSLFFQEVFFWKRKNYL